MQSCKNGCVIDGGAKSSGVVVEWDALVELAMAQTPNKRWEKVCLSFDKFVSKEATRRSVCGCS